MNVQKFVTSDSEYYVFTLENGNQVTATQADVDCLKNYLAMHDAGTLPEGL